MSKTLENFRQLHPALADTPAQLAAQITRLERALRDMGNAMAHQAAADGFAFVEGCEPGNESVNAAVTAYRTVLLHEAQNATDTVILPGILGVDRSLFECVNVVNKEKRALKTLCGQLDKHRVYKHSEAHGERERLVRHLLGLLGKDGFSRLSAYRQVKIFDEQIEHVSFTRSFSRRVYCLTRDAVIEQLQQSHPDASGDLDIMEDRKPGEYFAHALGYTTTIRANVRLPRHWPSIKREREQRKREGKPMTASEQGLRQLYCPMPILVPTDRQKGVPTVTFPKRSADDLANGKVRTRPGHLRAAPLLSSMSVYEYVDGYVPRPLRKEQENQRAVG